MITAKKLQWAPILKPNLIVSVAQHINTIASRLYATKVDNCSASRIAEHALLFGYLARTKSDSVWQERAAEYLSLLVESTSKRQYVGESLFGGLSGIGWNIEHLSWYLGSEDQQNIDLIEDPIQEIDEALIDRLVAGPWSTSCSLIDGLIGVGIYFLERLPSPSVQRGIDLILYHLRRQSEYCWGGLTWAMPTHVRPYVNQAEVASGYYDLGIGYGILGVISFLGQLALAQAWRDKVYTMLCQSIDWLLARQRHPNRLTLYSSYFIPGEEQRDSEQSWCYGDLGVGMVLYDLGQRINRRDWEQHGKNLLSRCLVRTPDKICIPEASLCHGVAGNAHIFNRLYQRTADERYGQAARLWFRELLALESRRLKGDDPCKVTFQQTARRVDSSILFGEVGTALTLLSSAYPIEPSWDRMLLLSGRELTL